MITVVKNELSPSPGLIERRRNIEQSMMLNGPFEQSLMLNGLSNEWSTFPKLLTEHKRHIFRSQ